MQENREIGLGCMGKWGGRDVIITIKFGLIERVQCRFNWLSGSSTGSCFTFYVLFDTINLQPGKQGKEDTMNHNSLGSKISEYRQNKRMTQEELAGRIGVTPQALSKWERGQSLPDVSLLTDLCQILGCSADYLLGIGSVKITENNDEKSQNEIWVNLRNCLEPLELTFGKNLVPAFMDDLYVEQIVQVRKNLSAEGILMPLVRVRDDMNLDAEEFMILSYHRELYRETFSQGTDSVCKYMMECLEKTVREKYAEILNRDIVKEMVQNLQKRYPVLISETVPKVISYGFLTDVLKRFIAGGNSCLYLVKVIEIMDDMLRQKGPVSAEELAEELAERLSLFQ